MNDPFKTWTDAWTANQQALMKSMFPQPEAAAAEGGEAPAPLEEQFRELRDTWQASIEKWTEFAKGDPKAGALTPEALHELFGPSAWSGPGAGAFDAGLRQVLEGPKYATLFDQDRKLMELQQRAAQRDRDVAAYQAVVQKAWNTAFERFSTSFAAARSDRPGTWRGLTDRWLKVVNDTLIEVHRSDEFLEAQRRMLRSAADYRLQERKIAEAWCEASHIPTRTEMDEMQRTVIELKRQLRVLQQENAAQAAKVGQAAQAAKAAAAPSTPAVAGRKPAAAARKPAAAARKPATGAGQPAAAARKPASPRKSAASGKLATRSTDAAEPRKPSSRRKSSPARRSTRA